MDSSDVSKKHEEEKFTTEDVIKAFNESQGCILTGLFEVIWLPGNFHVASHTFAPIIKDFKDKGQHIHFNLTHTIYRISFEDEKVISLIREKFNEGIMTPMDGFYLVDDTQGTLLNYFLIYWIWRYW